MTPFQTAWFSLRVRGKVLVGISAASGPARRAVVVAMGCGWLRALDPTEHRDRTAAI